MVLTAPTVLPSGMSSDARALTTDQHARHHRQGLKDSFHKLYIRLIH
jgi:hypothetical protein